MLWRDSRGIRQCRFRSTADSTNTTWRKALWSRHLPTSTSRQLHPSHLVPAFVHHRPNALRPDRRPAAGRLPVGGASRCGPQQQGLRRAAGAAGAGAVRGAAHTGARGSHPGAAHAAGPAAQYWHQRPHRQREDHPHRAHFVLHRQDTCHPRGDNRRRLLSCISVRGSAVSVKLRAAQRHLYI